MEKETSASASEPAGVTGTIDLVPRDDSPVVDLTGRVHLLPCSVKHNGPSAVSDYFKPRETDVEVEGMSVQEAFFRGRKLCGLAVPIPDGYRGYVLEKPQQGKGKGLEYSDRESNCWQSRGQFGNITYWNHDNMPSSDDPLRRCFHWFPISDAKMANNMSNLVLRSVIEKDKFHGTNFLDWFRNLRIVLKLEKKLYVLEQPLPDKPAADATTEIRDAYEKHINDSTDVSCIMLATMTSELQKQLEDLVAYDMITQLKEMFQEQSRIERFKTTKALMSCKMTPGSSVSAHVLKMKSYIDLLEKLDAPIGQKLATDVILGSLSPSFDAFIMNYNMHNMVKSLTELHGMLKNAEENMKVQGTNGVLMVQKGEGSKGKNKKKNKRKANGKGKEKSEPKEKRLKRGVCFFCDKPGHWKRNCPLYLEDLKKKKGSEASTSGIKKD